jgi:hypothetical protein
MKQLQYQRAYISKGTLSKKSLYTVSAKGNPAASQQYEKKLSVSKTFSFIACVVDTCD